MAMGGPDSLEGIGSYLNDVRGGRPTPPELVREITERYRLTGGKSPVFGITKDVAEKLETRFQAGGLQIRVDVGLRHWRPSIAETYRALVQEGMRRIVGVCMAPQNSALSVGAYIKKIEDARIASDDIPFSYVPSWNTHPMLIEAIARNIRETVERFPAEVRTRVPVLFTAHSLPARILNNNDPYPREVQATLEAVLAKLAPTVSRLAYQSQGRSEESWLGPTMEATVEELWQAGHRHVLVAPIGFVSDHVEILYDIDIEFKQVATKKGLWLERIPMLNATPPLVDTLEDVVTSHLKEHLSLTSA
jgi:ferrochelatase